MYRGASPVTESGQRERRTARAGQKRLIRDDVHNEMK